MENYKAAIPLLLLCVIFVPGCATVKATPGPIQDYYHASCSTPAFFSIDVWKTTGFGSFSFVRANLIINGKRIVLGSPSGTEWGRHEYLGIVPYDGEVRFRYMIESRRSDSSSFTTFYRPSDQYHHRKMGTVLWTGSTAAGVGNNFISLPQSNRPQRSLYLNKVLPDLNFTGILTVTETLTIQNVGTFRSKLAN